MDRGWRRSGTYLYLTYPDRNCCPTYTIRLHAPSFQPSAAQKKSLRRFDQFLSGEWAAKQQKQGSPQPPQRSLTDPVGTAHAQTHSTNCPYDPRSTGLDIHIDGAIEEGAPEEGCDAAVGPVALRAVGRVLTERLNNALYAAATQGPAEAPAAVQIVLGSSECVMFAVKGTSLDSGLSTPDGVATGAASTDEVSDGPPTHIVHLQSSLCWKAAAKYNSACGGGPSACAQKDVFKAPLGMAVAAAQSAVGVAAAAKAPAAPQVSKNQAKKARRLAAKAAATGTGAAAVPRGAESKKSVSCIAQELAEATQATLARAVENDVLLSALAPVSTCMRGHMHVSLRVPATMPSESEVTDAAASELRDILVASICASSIHAPKHAATKSLVPDDGADPLPAPGLPSTAAASSAADLTHAQRMLCCAVLCCC